MKKQLLLISAVLLTTFSGYAQTKIKDGTVAGSPTLPNSGAILELESTNKGLLLPRVALSSTTTWGLSGSITAGMTVYNTATANDVTPGYYYNDGTQWVRLSSGAGSSNAWNLTGNAGTTPPTAVGTAVGSANFWGTTDAKNLAIGTNSITRAILDQSGSIIGGTGNVSAAGSLASIVWGGGNTIINDLSLNQARIGGNALFGTSNTMSNTADGLGGTGANTIISGVNNQAVGASQAVFGEGNKITGGSAHNIMAGYGNTITSTGPSVRQGTGANAIFGNSNTLTAASTNYGTYCNLVFGTSNTARGYGNIVGGDKNTLVYGSQNCAIFGQSNTLGVSYSGQTFIAGSRNTTYAVDYGLIGGLGLSGINNSETVVGQYNDAVTGALFTVGNGTGPSDQYPSTATVRSNAFVVTRNQTTSASTNGIVIYSAALPVYADDSAADADTSLPSGAFYKVSSSRAVYQKP